MDHGMTVTSFPGWERT